MNKKVYSVYDSKVNAWMQPFFMRSRGEAIRGITEAANDPQHNLNKYSSDYTLFEIGEWDEEHGNMMPYEAKANLGILTEFKTTFAEPKIKQAPDVDKHAGGH